MTTRVVAFTLTGILLLATPAMGQTGFRPKLGAPFRILGTDDRSFFPPVIPGQPPNPLPQALLPLAGALFRYGIGCTGTHIGGGYVLTAGHCVNSNPGTRSAASGKPSSSVFAYNVLQRHIDTTGSEAFVITHAFGVGMDYAVLSVPEITGHQSVQAAYTFGPRSGAPSTTPLSVTFIGLSRDRLAATQGCKAFPQIMGGRLVMYLHTCDTEDGDSGAPLLVKARLGEQYRVAAVHGGYYGNATVNGEVGEYNYAFPVGQVAWTEQVCATEIATMAPIPDTSGRLVLSVQGNRRLTRGFYVLEGSHPAHAQLDIVVRDWTGAATGLPVTQEQWSLSGTLESREDSRLSIEVRDTQRGQKGIIKNALLTICP